VTPTGRVGGRSGPLPLSVAQTRLWHLSQLAPSSPAFNEVVTIRKAGRLDVDALRRALSGVVARHEVWRTSFRAVDGVPHQFVGEPADVDLPLTDLTHLGFDDAVERAAEIAAADTVRPFDLARGPLLRARLIRISEEDHRLQLGLHQLVFDATTLQRVLVPELTALYRSHATGVRLPLPDPPAQYGDYTTWELEWARGPEVAGRIARWRARLAGSTASQLPLDRPRPPYPTFAGGTIPLTIPPATVDGLRRAARAAGGDLTHALAAAYAWWLHRYAGSTNVVFGSTHDLRAGADLQAVAGNCTTPVALRCDVSGEETFTALVGRIRAVLTEALSDAVPFDTLLAGLGVPRDPLGSKLFHTQLLFQSALTSPPDEWSLHPMGADGRDAVGSATFDISIELAEQPDGHVVGGLVFSADVFDRATAHDMASHWCRLLDAVAAEPGIPMADHDLVTPQQRQRQLSWNQRTDDPTSPHCVHEVISAQVERTPDAVAVEVGGATLTYRQLEDRAAVIATWLVQAGAGPATVVALLLERTPDVVAAILGVLKSGAAFLPLDPRQPAARNTFCINDVGADILLTDQTLPAGGDTISATVLNLNDLRPGPHPPGRGAPPSTVSPTDLAYVICTSGSTGRPKPVLIEHRGATNLTATLSREFGIAACDTVLSVASISFDMALFDIFSALACGARVVLATTEEAVNPAALGRLIAHGGATYMFATPSTWGALIAAGWRGDRRLRAAAGGETLTDALAQALLQRCGALWNGYGPTEATAGTSIARLTEGDTITVGRPFPNVRVYITDPQGRLQPVGVPGEITIGGIGVGRGYLNRPDEHARRFGEDPFHHGGRIYRTGDRARYLPDGRIQHLGRDDDQLKIRGFRIEPGEIESTLCQHPAVARCAVVARPAPHGEQWLVAYIVGEPEHLNDTQARAWLRQRLPEYMIPGAFMHLDALPMTPNGKLDKTALPPPPPPAPHPASAQPPRTDTEIRIAALWADLLGTPVTDISSDFFDLGGHSLLAARLIAEVEQTFGITLSLESFIDSGRIVAKLAELLTTETPTTTTQSTPNPPLHFIFSDLASAMSLRHFTTQWGPTQPVHALIPHQPGGHFDRSTTIEDHARHALSTIRHRQPDGPLALVGYSLGGLVAYEIARQAADAGQHVHYLAVLDAVAPPMHDLERARLTLRWQLHRLHQLPTRQRLAKYAHVAHRILRGGPRALWPQEDFDYRGATHIACRYQQPGHQVPMHLFVSESTATAAEQDLLGWNEFHQGPLTAHHLPGNHDDMLQPPNTQQLATTIHQTLTKTTQPTPPQPTPTTPPPHLPKTTESIGSAGPT